MIVKPCERRPLLTPCTLEGRNYQMEPYIGCEHYCYYCYALNQAETDWRREVKIHENIVDQLNSELTDIPPQTIYMGWQTDAYQPCEAEYRQTRQVLELFVEKGFSASILTKSDLILRDLDLFQKMDTPSVSFSLAFTDTPTCRLFEANTVDIEKRVEALRQLKKTGVRTGALLCPVIPYITDAIQLIDMLAPVTDVIWIYSLSIEERSNFNWLNLKKILSNKFPELCERIESVTFSKNHMYWTDLRNDLERFKNGRKLNLNIRL